MNIKALLRILTKLTIIGNATFLIWVVLSGINDGFGNLNVKTFSYTTLVILLVLNIVVYVGQGITNGKKLHREGFIILGILALFLALGMSSLIYLKSKYPTTKPFTAVSYIYESYKNPHKQMSKHTIGFLPYWRMDDAKYIKHDLMTEVIYFSLTADENGDLVKVVGNETDPGWRWWTSDSVKNLVAKTQISGGKFSIAIAMQKNDTLESFLDNQQAQKNLVTNLLDLVVSNKLDGLNIDFEYAGKISDESYKDKFTNFATLLSSEFRSKSPNTKLSIDFYPISVRSPNLFDIPKLAPLFDNIVVMSYDYYGSSSTVSGPIAPMGGYEEKKYFFDVNTTYKDYLEIVPKEKIIMGIPYYAWDYPVLTNKQPMSKVLPQTDENGYTEVMSYGRMRSNPDIKPENCKWDELAQENWCVYTDTTTGKFHQIWLEDNRSLDIKFEFANKNQLGGVAIWTLGYDKDYPDLWDMIENKYAIHN